MNREIRKVIAFSTAALIIFIIAGILTSIHVMNLHKDSIYRLKASIVAIAIEESSNSETQILDLLNDIDSFDSTKGVEMLSKIGLGPDSLAKRQDFNILQNNMIFYVTLLILLVHITYIIFLIYGHKKQKSRIDELIYYLEAVSVGNYSLDLRDNQEGSLSILKNNIYKITGMLKEHNEELTYERNELAKAISDISHQIKTPLTSLQVTSDVLRKGNIPKSKLEEFHRIMQNQISRLNWLVSALLKLAKLDSNTVKMKSEKVYIKELMEKVIQPFLVPIELKEINISISGDNKTFYLGDFEWSLEAFSNMIKNCIEHTEMKGKIFIEFSSNPLYTEIIIEDTGKGIAKEDIPYILNRFYRGKNAASDSVGIGLALSKSIIENQNGIVKVESKLGIGTKFMIKFYKTKI